MNTSIKSVAFIADALLTERLPGMLMEFSRQPYTDNGLSVPHCNPVVADANGDFPPIFLPPLSGRVKVSTADGRVLSDTPLPLPNTSGIEPLDQRVLVKPDSAEKRSAGGIILPDSNVEQKEWAQIKGTLIAVGVNAWSEAKATRGFVPPEPGARILFAKYGGITFEGDDGEKYRIMNDEDITAILKEG